MEKLGKELFKVKYLSDRIMATFGYMVLMLVLFRGLDATLDTIKIILYLTIFGFSISCIFVNKKSLKLFLRSSIIE